LSLSVVSVQNLERLGQQELPKLDNSMSAQRVMARQGKNPESLLAGSPFKHRPVHGNDDLLVAARHETLRQHQQLNLPAA
jgi:hypothetical protein